MLIMDDMFYLLRFVIEQIRQKLMTQNNKNDKKPMYYQTHSGIINRAVAI
jgi:hypothetical protein